MPTWISRLAAAVLWLAPSTLVPPAGAAPGDYHLRGEGFAFPAALPAQGEALELVGRLDPEACDAPFPMSAAGREYTWTVYGPVVHSIEEVAPGIRTLHLTFGILEIREDVFVNSQFFADPPNAVVPSTFHDGETVLVGSLADFRIREIFGILSASAEVVFEMGKNLGDLGSATIWSLGAGISPFGDEIPPGYGSHWNLELTPRQPMGVESDTWGGIKALYR